MIKNEYTNIEELISQLKQKDLGQMNLYKRVSIFYAVMMPFYFVSVIYLISLEFDETAKIFAVNQFCFFIIFSLFFVFFRKTYLKLKNIDYSIPILEVFQNARKRYTFWNGEKWIIITSIILLDIIFTNKFSDGYNPDNILLIQIIYFSVISLAMLIRYFVWKSKYKPLLLGIESIIKDIEKV